MQPLELQLLADAPALDRADISIRGLNMDMGILAFKLPDAIKGGFAGEGILPVCSQERMEWEALARLHTQDGFILVPFTFSTRQ